MNELSGITEADLDALGSGITEADLDALDIEIDFAALDLEGLLE